MTTMRALAPALFLAAASALCGVAGTLLVQRLTGADAPAAPDPSDLPTLPAPDAALQRELDGLRAAIERLEGAPIEPPQASVPEPAATPAPEAVAALAARIDQLESLLAQIAAGAEGAGAMSPLGAEPDRRAVAELVGQVFDAGAAMRTRLDSLQVLGRMDPSARPFASVDLAAVKDLIASIAADERRRRTWRSLRAHVDRQWLPVLTDAARGEAVDAVRAEILELFAPLVEDPEVKTFLRELARDPAIGEASRDAIRDLVR